jgi:pimeloyl-ACP methyl ester carboxylesterase
MYVTPSHSSLPLCADDNKPLRAVIVAHSMGGMVARAALLMTSYAPGSVDTIITLGTPHQRSVRRRERCTRDGTLR